MSPRHELIALITLNYSLFFILKILKRETLLFCDAKLQTFTEREAKNANIL